MQDHGSTWRERGLKEAVLVGDEDAWRLWYDECADSLFAYVCWRCGGLRDDAEEVVQDVWMTAVRRLPAFDPTAGSFLGWLRGIAAGVLANRFRRNHGRLPIREGTSEPADAEVCRREAAQRVASALASLPANYEAVLRGKYLDGQSVSDIATGLGLTAKAVESLLTRARGAFRKAYQPEE